jgi:superfamily II DNA or RNA helicase
MQLRDYQIKDYASIVEAFSVHNSVMYQLSTGGGKTVVISHFVKDLLLQGKRVLILVHKERLLRQTLNTLKGLKISVGHIIRSEHIKLDADCIVASVSTVMRSNRIDLIKDRYFDYVIIDEAHHSVTSSFTRVLEAANHGSPCKILGVTATPYRTDSKNLKEFFDYLVVSTSNMRQLIKEKYLSEYKISATPVKNLKNLVGKAGSDYKQSELSSYMREPEIIQYLVDSYKNYANGRKTIVFCVDRKHAKQVMDAYIENDFWKIAYIDSEVNDEDRDAILYGFQEDIFDIIVCIETLTEGIDLPECNCIQLARPTLSLILYLQMVGRGLRPKPQGGDCIILDNAGCVLEFGVPDAYRNWQLDSDKNPVIPGDKTLVGRRKDGSLTDDIESDSFEEIFEMDYNDFIRDSIGDVEKAKEINENISKSVLSSKKGLIEYILSGIKETGWTIKENWKHEIFTLGKAKYEEIEFTFYENRLKIVSGYYTSSNFGVHLQTGVFKGKMCEFIIKNEKHILNTLEKINKESKKTINISKLKEEIEKKKVGLALNLLISDYESGKAFYEYEENIGHNWSSNLKPSLEGRIKSLRIIGNPSLKKIEVEAITIKKNWYDKIPITQTHNFKVKSEVLFDFIKLNNESIWQKEKEG